MRILTVLDAAAVAELRAAQEFFWLDLLAPDEAQIRELGRMFGYSPLAVEDTLEFGQRPKLDDYRDHALVVYFGLQDGEPVEVHCYISGEAIVTVRREHCRTFDDAHKRLAHLDPQSEEQAIYRVLDALTDSYFPAIEAIQEQIENLQETSLASTDTSHREAIFALRRRLMTLRRIVGNERDMFATAGGTIEGLPGLSADEAHDYFRDIYDHLLRINDSIDSSRELLSSALDLHLSAISQRVNQVTKQLTLVATIFLPLTFVTGFFGQNFAWMIKGIGSESDFFVYGIGGLAVAMAILVVYFRRSGFFND